MNFAHKIEQLAAQGRWLDAPAFLTPARPWSHAETHQAARRLAALLTHRGVHAGDSFLIAIEDSMLWVAAFLASARLGATTLVVNPHLTREEHLRICQRHEPRLALVNEALAVRFSAVATVSPGDCLPCLNHFDGESFDAFGHTQDPLYVQFTSGTTGEQKAVPHSHADMLVYRDAVGRAMLGLRQEDVLFSASRMFFAYGFGNSLAFPLTLGACSVLLPERPCAQDAWDALQRYSVSVAFWVPSGFAALLREAHGSPSRSLRLAVSAGEALPPALANRVTERLGVPLLNQLGSTEAGHAYCGTSSHDDPAVSVGRPLPGYKLEVRDVVTSEGVTDGDEGELWLSGPTLPTCYWSSRDVAEGPTQGQFIAGWFRTGDRGKKLMDGRFQHLGRVDDMEKVGGIKVPPLEVEAVLSSHQDVLDVGVVAVVHQDGASHLWAFVVCRQALAEIETALRELAQSRLSPFMVPHVFVAVKQLPRTANGKLQRHVLRSDIWMQQVLSSQQKVLSHGFLEGTSS